MHAGNYDSTRSFAKFKELLVEEDNEDAVFRIRETKVGGG